MTDTNEIAVVPKIADLTCLGLSKEENNLLIKAAMKKSLSTVEGMNSVMLTTLSPNVRKRVETLQEIQAVHDGLVSAYRVELAALEAKYDSLYAPLYTKRYEIINGISEVDGIVPEEADPPVKGIPEFWMNALCSNDMLSCEINDDDKEVLKYVKDIKCSKLEDANGFKLEFYFDTNPFFSNSVLSKLYFMTDDEDEHTLEKATGTVINWFPGKNILKAPNVREVERSDYEETSDDDDEDSFFQFFNPPEVPTDISELDDHKAANLQNIMERDLDIGFTIKEKIITKAILWFTGEAMDDDLYLDLGDSDTESSDGEEVENGHDEKAPAAGEV
ncbi:hypothetical protein ZOSMA_65G00570 [Zostera marina]|uniref:Nucleosome assembly protein n=1 Tax=Zostera marina TaxID=29655 RepID=A0A0K9NUV0_ZOSMR|nr:hypothetical protein ZOSMA_65G00570 [Zostera marina]